MTGRPYGGADEGNDDGSLPGERPEHGEVRAAPAEEPRAAVTPMPTDDQGQGVPGSGGSPNSAGPPDAGRP
jgi:hypothetical protein